VLRQALADFSGMPASRLVEERQEKFRRMGAFDEESVPRR
jgi:acetyl-CoA carboxylase alpha subunit